MTIQIGQISSVSQGGPVSKLLENQLTAAERFNVPSFRLSVLKQLGLPEPNRENRQADEIFDTLRSVPAKSADLINVQVSAYSRDEAIKALKSSFQSFEAEHRKMYDPTVTRMRADLKWVTDKLVEADREYQFAADSLRAAAEHNGKAESRDVLLNSTAATLNQQIVDLNRKKADLEDTLAPLRTYPSQIFGELYAPERPTTPSTFALILLGVLGGLAVGLAGVMLTHSLRQESAWS